MIGSSDNQVIDALQVRQPAELDRNPAPALAQFDGHPSVKSRRQEVLQLKDASLNLIGARRSVLAGLGCDDFLWDCVILGSPALGFPHRQVLADDLLSQSLTSLVVFKSKQCSAVAC